MPIIDPPTTPEGKPTPRCDFDRGGHDFQLFGEHGIVCRRCGARIRLTEAVSHA